MQIFKFLQKHSLSLLGTLIAFLLLFYAIHLYQGAFRLSNITMELPSENQWSTPRLAPEEMEHIFAVLNQPYKFIGQGNQVFAFESENGNIIVKFFKFGHLKPSKWFVDAHSENTKLRKIKRIFDAHLIAYNFDRQNSGLLYAHLNGDDRLERNLNVKDRYGFSHVIPLDQTYFVLQRKGIPLSEIIDEQLRSGNVAGAKKKFQQVMEMYLSEYLKGIFDNDHNIMINVGFAGERPMRLDVGKVVYDQAYTKPEFYHKDLDKLIHKRIGVWLQKHYPQYKDEIVQHLSSLKY